MDPNSRDQFPLFPRGPRIGPHEVEAWEIARTLRPVLDRLSRLVMEHWRSNGKPSSLTDAAASLTLAGVSLQGNVKTIGKFVVSQVKPYWNVRKLVTVEEMGIIRNLGDDTISTLLDEAIALDSRLRSRLEMC